MIKTQRCGWCVGNALYETYHDEEWGKPVFDDRTLFEFLILETFQAGLSWITVLKKRENFRNVLDNFDSNKIANYKQEKIETLLKDTNIIRNKLKIVATVNNAQAFNNVQKEFGSFSTYIWRFVAGKPIKNAVVDYKNAPSNTILSNVISKDLKQRGFKFVGSTIVYAYMQAIGMVNDHEIHCFRYENV